jgi:hypothetical protein
MKETIQIRSLVLREVEQLPLVTHLVSGKPDLNLGVFRAQVYEPLLLRVAQVKRGSRLEAPDMCW